MGSSDGISPVKAARCPSPCRPLRDTARANNPNTVSMSPITTARARVATMVFAAVPGATAQGNPAVKDVHCGVDSRPSKVTEPSNSNTKTTRLVDASNPTPNPPANPRCPDAPNRQNPSRPQVANRTLNNSPRAHHALAPNTRPPVTQVSEYTISP